MLSGELDSVQKSKRIEAQKEFGNSKELFSVSDG